MLRVETSQSRLESSLEDRLQKLDEKIGSRLDEVSHHQDIIQADVDELSNKCEAVEAENGKLQSRVADLEEKLDMAENRSRRCNLLFWGIPTAVRETWEDCEKKMMDIIHNKMEIDDNIVIDRAHRVGTAIIVAFCFFKDKQRVLSCGNRLKGTNISMREDFSQAVRRKRQGLFSLQKSFKNDGKRAVLNFDKLKTEDGTYTFDLSDNTIIKLPAKTTVPVMPRRFNSYSDAVRSSPPNQTQSVQSQQPLQKGDRQHDVNQGYRRKSYRSNRSVPTDTSQPSTSGESGTNTTR
ncbi:hypothetical protein ACOMHN_006528 [Nucella lapillus]